MDGMLFDLPTTPPRGRAKRRNAQRGNRRAAEQWPLDGAINVVLFAGMGGACQGLEEAGLPIHVACNHDEVAIAAHRSLNPHTRHVTGDLFDVDPLAATNGRRVKTLWASPDCKDHSSAKGGAPRSPRVRSLPWQVCRWAAKTRPDLIMMENVREIRGWGPLVAKRDKKTGRVVKLDGTVAAPGERVPVRQQQLVRDTRRLGKTFRRWRRHLEALGYVYEDRDLCCADFGVPTSRRRWFAVARRDGLPIRWPAVTHGPRKSAAVLAGKLQPERAAAEIIDWSLPLPSIFDRPKDLAPATQKRIAVGMKRFVIEAERPFLVHLTHHGDRRPMDIDGPPPTFTGAHRGEMAVVGAAVVPTTHTSSGARVHDGRAPTPTLTAGVKGGEFAVLGIEVRGHGGWSYDRRYLPSVDRKVAEAIAATIVGAGGRAGQSQPFDVARPLNASTTKEDRVLAAAHLVGIAHGDDAKSGSRTYDALDALRTATGSNDQAVIAAHLTRFRQNNVGASALDPISTITTGQALDGSATGTQFGVIAAHLTRYHGERRPGEERGVAPGQSLPTQTTENRFGIVGAALAPAMMANNTNNVGASMLDGVPALTTGNRDYVLGAMLVSTSNTGTTGRAPYVWHPDESLRTLLTSGSQAVVAAAMVQTGYGERDGQAPRALDLQQPLGTLVAGGAKHAVIGAWMVQHNTGVIGHEMTDALSTMTTIGTQQQLAAAYLTELRGTSRDGQPATDPAGTMCTGGGRGGGHHAVTAAFLSEYYSVGGQHQGCMESLNTLTTNDRFAVTGATGIVPPLSPEILARARKVADLLRRHGVWDEREFVTVTIRGVTYTVTDLLMRMLTPREGAAAHELRMPDQITVPKRDRKGLVVTDEDGNVVYVTRALTKTEAMRLVGNSVPKRMAKLLAQANAQHALHAPSFAAE